MSSLKRVNVAIVSEVQVDPKQVLGPERHYSGDTDA